jgi:predicted helicase
MERSAHIQQTGTGNGANRQLEKLACRVSCLALSIRERTITTFTRGIASNNMQELFDQFKQAVNSDVTADQFADIFAQTLAYGLFTARFNHSGLTRFQRQHASSALPITNAFLAKLFATISGPELHDEPFMCYVDELVDLLAETDAHIFLAGSNQLASQKDALSWLYEKFLEQYDPQLRDLRGVYYTPEPVVSYIVRSVDLLLRTHFNRQDGLAGEEGQVILLDPACGTGIFLQAVIKHIRGEFQKTGNARGWQAYVHAQLLPHLFGFELLMAPYLIAHLKLAMQLAALDLPESERPAWAYHVEHDEHLNIYLANTLEQGEETRTGRGQAPTNPIMVILGNPPYAGHSVNKGQLINTLLDAYKEGCPELKKPGQAKWLSDDYVKFIRFAQWNIEQAGYGILAFITNHSYLDNPTFRGMRRSLLQSFDDLYILDLHGNSKKQEQAPSGSKDENIFDIQQGVAISIFVKWREISSARGAKGGDGQGRRDQGGDRHGAGAQGGASPAPTLFAKVHHANLWGFREVYELDDRGQTVLTGGKYCWLVEHDLASTQWTVLIPQAPFYAFAPLDNRYFAEYEAGWSVADIFRPNGDPAPGVVTCHDQFAISWTATEASGKVERFLSTETEAEARQLFRLCSQHQWQYAVAKSELRRGTWHNDITEILYRPFDRRWTIFNRYVAVHRRERVMRHMLAGENIGLTIGRAGQVIDQDEWDIAFCTRLITEFNLYRRGGNNLFPLYLYDEASLGVRKANLAVNFIADCAARLRMTWIADGRGDLERTFGPEDVFTYMYALFYSPAYRKRYAPFLKIDFPRLPLTSNCALYRALCSIGERLAGLHLMDQRVALISCFPVPGDNCVEAVRYITQSQPEANARVWINATQYFEDVPLEAWKFSIGGYQICKKWLKDRKGHKLSDDALAHYQQIVAILAETSRLMSEIDEVIEKYGGWPL